MLNIKEYEGAWPCQNFAQDPLSPVRARSISFTYARPCAPGVYLLRSHLEGEEGRGVLQQGVSRQHSVRELRVSHGTGVKWSLAGVMKIVPPVWWREGGRGDRWMNSRYGERKSDRNDVKTRNRRMDRGVWGKWNVDEATGIRK